MPKVITYQSPRGDTINLTRGQCRLLAAMKVWPRDEHGAEYCTVSYGLHTGPATYSDDDLDTLVTRLRAA